MIANEEVLFFSLLGKDNKKKETRKSPFFIDLNGNSYFTTNLMVLLKPLALMVQK